MTKNRQQHSSYDAALKNSDRRRKRVRLYTVLAYRRDDPLDMYGVMLCRRRGRLITLAEKNKCIVYGSDMQDKSAQERWNHCAYIARMVAAAGRVKNKVRHVSRPPAFPDFPGTCYDSVETTVKRPFNIIHVVDGGRERRMPVEEFRFFPTRIWSRNCPVEFGSDAERGLHELVHRRLAVKRPDQLLVKFSVKKDFDFNRGRSAVNALSACRDHEPGPASAEAQAGVHKPVNPVAAAVHVLRCAGIQNLASDEMRKGPRPKRSGSEGDTKAPVRNSESAALSQVHVFGY